jgi:hypothetical protein
MDEEIKKEPVPEDVWVRGGSDTLLTQGLDGMLNLLTSSLEGYVKDVEKDVKKLKKFQ